MAEPSEIEQAYRNGQVTLIAHLNNQRDDLADFLFSKMEDQTYGGVGGYVYRHDPRTLAQEVLDWISARRI